MADIPITVDGGTSKRLLTAGKYCDKNILVTATGGGTGGQELADSLIDRSITEITSDVVTVGMNALSNCTKLTKANFPKATRIESTALRTCTSLTDIQLPLAEKILNSALTGCSSLKEVILQKTILLQAQVFQQCVNLSKVDMYAIETIDVNVFSGCSKLETVIIRTESVCTLGNISSFVSTPIASGTGYIYVPKSLAEEYKQASNWTTYADQIRAIEDYPEITGGAQV